MRRVQTPRRGNVAVLVAFALVAILGFTAIAVDGGLLQHNRRIVQATADAAALAAADDLFSKWLTNSGLDPSGTAAARAQAIAAAAGFSNNLTDSKVTVNIPPQAGTYQGQAGYAEVIIEQYQARAFSAVWSGGSITVRARAVAQGRWASVGNGILVLDPHASGALQSNGNGTVTVQNANVVIDSDSSTAATASGNGVLTAPDLYITGKPGTSTSGGGQINGTISSGQTPIPDPLAYLPEPSTSGLTVQATTATVISSSGSTTLQPGVYQGGISVSGKASLTMAPGIYYMQGGGFSFSGQGNLSATGVLIVNAPQSSSDQINISGQGTVTLSPPTSGIYAGISIWQTRTSTNTVYIVGNGGASMSGTFYAQHGTLSITGNGTGDILGSQHVSYDVYLGGNGSYSVIWQQNAVGHTRLLNLVE